MSLRRSLLRFVNIPKPSQKFVRVQNYSAQAASKDDDKRKTHFGFETVDEEEKTKKGKITNYILSITYLVFLSCHSLILKVESEILRPVVAQGHKM